MKLFGRTNAQADQPQPGLDKKQRVELMIRGVGRTSGLVEEVEADSVLVALVVSATQEARSLEAPDAVLEYTGPRGLYRQKGYASFNGHAGEKVRFVSQEQPELMQRRQFARVEVNMPVDVTLKGVPWPASFDALNLSANGILLAAPPAGMKRLELGTFLAMKIPLYDKQEAISVRGTVVRQAHKGSVGIRFDHINESDQERLVRYVMKCEREQRKRGAV